MEILTCLLKKELKIKDEKINFNLILVLIISIISFLIVLSTIGLKQINLINLISDKASQIKKYLLRT